jgi:hypothetical protein
LSVGTAHGIKSSTKHKGTLRLVLTDDDGNDHSYDVSDVVYDPDSPYSLLGILFLAAYFAKHNGSEDRFDGGTWIKSAHSQFVWDGEKHERNFNHGDSLLPELWLYQGTSYFTAFCTRMRRYVNDKIENAFSSAFSMPQQTVHIIPPDDEEDTAQSVQWYTPDHSFTTPSPKKVRFDTSAKPPSIVSPPPRDQDFELGMNLVYRDGAGKVEPVFYEGVNANGLDHIVRCKDGTMLQVHDSNISFLNQIDMMNIPSTPLDYCKEVGIGLTKEEAQILARPRTLTPLHQELMSWHNRLYHLPFHRIFALAK